MDDAWVQRNKAPRLHVQPVHDVRDGDYEEDVPSVRIRVDDIYATCIDLTWKEARDLAQALLKVEGILHHG